MLHHELHRLAEKRAPRDDVRGVLARLMELHSFGVPWRSADLIGGVAVGWRMLVRGFRGFGVRA